MYKLLVVLGFLAYAYAAPAPGYVAAPVVTHAVSSHSTVVAHPVPVVHAAPIVKAVPVVHAAPIIKAVPVVHAAPIVHAVPVAHSAVLVHH